MGGKKLGGQVTVGGSKNAVLPILAGAVLGRKSIIHNCPQISDTQCTLEILTALGCGVKTSGGTVEVDARGINNWHLPPDLMGKMRSSIILAGGLLGRLGKASAIYPGGCQLGERPINLHLEAFRQLGAHVEDEDGVISIKAKRLTGAKIHLDVPSVGATQNAVLAAVRAKGATIIQNAAREPEIIDLQRFLVAAGAKVWGAGHPTIIVEGVADLRDVEYTIMPDRIVAGTYMAAAAITGGKVRLEGVNGADVRPVAAKLAQAGCAMAWEKDAAIIAAPKGGVKAVGRVDAGPHPGFPTDMQPQFTALMAVAKGECIISDGIFESRDKHIAELNSLGADITNIDSRNFSIKGVGRLHGGIVTAHDLRGGAALILAGLAAQGETVVEDAKHVARGYEDIARDLRALGADIELES